MREPINDIFITKTLWDDNFKSKTQYLYSCMRDQCCTIINNSRTRSKASATLDGKSSIHVTYCI